MGLMSRFTMIVKAKANKALDKAEDPRETLDYSYEKQLELLQKVRRGVADVATSKKRLELQAAKLEQSVEKLDGQARMALQQNREDLARVALERKKGVQLQLQSIDEQRAQLQAEQDKLVLAEQRLSAKVESFRTRKETIKAQYTAAEAQAKIGEAFSGVSEEMADVGMAIERAENKTETMRARAGRHRRAAGVGGADRPRRPARPARPRAGAADRVGRRGRRPRAAQGRAGLRRAREAGRPDRGRGEGVVIVRILGEGQYRLDDEAFALASRIDDRVQAAADAGRRGGLRGRAHRAGGHRHRARRAAAGRRPAPLRRHRAGARHHPGGGARAALLRGADPLLGALGRRGVPDRRTSARARARAAARTRPSTGRAARGCCRGACRPAGRTGRTCPRL